MSAIGVLVSVLLYMYLSILYSLLILLLSHTQLGLQALHLLPQGMQLLLHLGVWLIVIEILHVLEMIGFTSWDMEW